MACTGVRIGSWYRRSLSQHHKSALADVVSYSPAGSDVLAPPDRVHQWVTDFVILPVIGLTGPFIAVFMPLFLWRWWRERSTYSLAVLLVAGVCAGIQSYLVVTTGPHYFVQSEHFNLEMLSGVVGSRWIVWPLFGPAIALARFASLGACDDRSPGYRPPCSDGGSAGPVPDCESSDSCCVCPHRDCLRLPNSSRWMARGQFGFG